MDSNFFSRILKARKELREWMNREKKMSHLKMGLDARIIARARAIRKNTTSK